MNAQQKKVRAIFESLDSQLVERNEVLRGFIVAVLARKHLFAIGPPGTAKSLVGEKFCKSVTNANYFEWLMGKFTKPEDIFGPVRVTKLKEDKYERNTTHQLPEAHIAFLDEIWKASDSINASLLRITDESRRFYQSGQTYQTPIHSVFAASNELPEDMGNALWDRFLLRYYVGDIVDDANFKKMMQMNGFKITETITLEELEKAQAQVDKVTIPEAILDTVVELRSKMKREGFEFSPRRWNESNKILQAHAWFEGRNEVTSDDLGMLANIFWNQPDEQRQVRQIIFSFCNPELEKALVILDTVTELHGNALEADTTAAGAEANDKIKKLLKGFPTVVNNAKVDEVRSKIDDLQREVLTTVLQMNL
jgi:MoxR-like ATPase